MYSLAPEASVRSGLRSLAAPSRRTGPALRIEKRLGVALLGIAARANFAPALWQRVVMEGKHPDLHLLAGADGDQLASVLDQQVRARGAGRSRFLAEEPRSLGRGAQGHELAQEAQGGRPTGCARNAAAACLNGPLHHVAELGLHEVGVR
jgi:hypothetical protein